MITALGILVSSSADDTWIIFRNIFRGPTAELGGEGNLGSGFEELYWMRIWIPNGRRLTRTMGGRTSWRPPAVIKGIEKSHGIWRTCLSSLLPKSVRKKQERLKSPESLHKPHHLVLQNGEIFLLKKSFASARLNVLLFELMDCKWKLSEREKRS